MKQMPKNNSSLVSKFLNFRYKFFLKMRWTKFQWIAFIAITNITWSILTVGYIVYDRVNKYNTIQEQSKVDSLQTKVDSLMNTLNTTRTLVDSMNTTLDMYKDSLKQSTNKVVKVNPFVDGKVMDIDKLSYFLSTYKVTGYKYQGITYRELKYHLNLN